MISNILFPVHTTTDMHIKNCKLSLSLCNSFPVHTICADMHVKNCKHSLSLPLPLPLSRRHYDSTPALCVWRPYGATLLLLLLRNVPSIKTEEKWSLHIVFCPCVTPYLLITSLGVSIDTDCSYGVSASLSTYHSTKHNNYVNMYIYYIYYSSACVCRDIMYVRNAPRSSRSSKRTMRASNTTRKMMKRWNVWLCSVTCIRPLVLW